MLSNSAELSPRTAYQQKLCTAIAQLLSQKKIYASNHQLNDALESIPYDDEAALHQLVDTQFDKIQYILVHILDCCGNLITRIITDHYRIVTSPDGSVASQISIFTRFKNLFFSPNNNPQQPNNEGQRDLLQAITGQLAAKMTPDIFCYLLIYYTFLQLLFKKTYVSYQNNNNNNNNNNNVNLDINDVTIPFFNLLVKPLDSIGLLENNLDSILKFFYRVKTKLLEKNARQVFFSGGQDPQIDNAQNQLMSLAFASLNFRYRERAFSVKKDSEQFDLIASYLKQVLFEIQSSGTPGLKFYTVFSEKGKLFKNVSKENSSIDVEGSFTPAQLLEMSSVVANNTVPQNLNDRLTFLTNAINTYAEFFRKDSANLNLVNAFINSLQDTVAFINSNKNRTIQSYSFGFNFIDEKNFLLLGYFTIIYVFAYLIFEQEKDSHIRTLRLSPHYTYLFSSSQSNANDLEKILLQNKLRVLWGLLNESMGGFGSTIPITFKDKVTQELAKNKKYSSIPETFTHAYNILYYLHITDEGLQK